MAETETEFTELIALVNSVFVSAICAPAFPLTGRLGAFTGRNRPFIGVRLSGATLPCQDH
ncbi:MAG: hypothetical protein KIT57_15005 [Blastocatellales bacterium]|nr:hypothetical protein [Blastocatellales bacterium]